MVVPGAGTGFAIVFTSCVVLGVTVPLGEKTKTL